MATAGNQLNEGSLSTLPEISPPVDRFAEVLFEVPSWYNLGVYLGAPMAELDAISKEHSDGTHDGTLRCLIELYRCIQRKGKSLSWGTIASTLKRMGNHGLADKIHTIVKEQLPSIQPRRELRPLTNNPNHGPVDLQNAKELKISGNELANEYDVILNQFILMMVNVRLAFTNAANLNLNSMQSMIKHQCGLPRLPQEVATIDTVFDRVEEECSILNFRILEFLVKNLLISNSAALNLLNEFKAAVDRFKSSANMVELVTLIKNKQTTPTGEQKMVTLKVREFWSEFTMKQFEIVINKIFCTLYDIMTHITVTEGCICLNWIIPDIVTTELLPVLPLELVRLIGVIYLHIGSDVIYNIEGEGCESIEAAMIQAIELKNTRAIELLLAVGCNPEVATYNGDNAVTSIVNIRAIESKESSSSDSSHSVDHVCILGHNKHVEAIVDPTSGGSEPEECSSCFMKEKMNKHLHQEVKDLHQKQRELCHENDSLHLTIKNKDSELNELQLLRAKEKEKPLSAGNQSTEAGTSTHRHQEFDSLHQKVNTLQLEKKALQKEVETNLEAIKMKDAEIALLKKSFEALKNKKDEGVHRVKDESIKSHISILPGKSTAVLPCRWRRVGIKAEMKMKVITRDNSSGKELATGGLEVRAILTCNEEECPITDNNDGTYIVGVIPQQLGQHQLYITVNGRYIQGSPFSLDIVPQRDYTKLNKPVQTITGITSPVYIAFIDNGDMFVTSRDDHRIHVYDASGKKKTTIGSGYGMGELQFKSPYGIDINGGVIYVAEELGHRIHQLTTAGEFICTFGGYASAFGHHGRFNHPHDVKISPDGKVYVADTYNYRVQVFNPDWSVSHVIDGRVSGDAHFSWPEGIAFDPLSGNVHITGHGSSSVTVFTSSGQFVCCYGERYIYELSGIAIDPSGYRLINDNENGRLSIFNSNGTFVHSVDGFKCPYGISISPVDGSIWIADTHNHRLVKY